MMHRPTLQVRQLRVSKGGKAVYDQTFHPGINIIRGDNSSGKSSVMDLLFFGLGGESIAWKPEPLSCDSVFVEALFNDEVAVLRRDISERRQQPLWVYYGTMVEAMDSAEGWTRYGYSRSEDRESFSQALFRLLDIPDITAADDSNLTVHQLLRLVYVDQMTPVSRLFRFEQFDTPQRRQAIGDLALGVYDGRIYSLQMQLREKERDFDRVASDLANLYRILGQTSDSVSVEFIEQQEATTRAELQQIEEFIEGARQDEAKQIEEQKKLQPGIIDQLRGDISTITKQIDSLADEISQLELSIEDSKALVSELSRNIEQLQEGFATNRALGGLSFSFCPACYSVVDVPDDVSCHVCKTPYDEDHGEARVGRIKSQIELQLKESDRLIGLKAEDRNRKLAASSRLQALRQSLQEEYRALRADYTSDNSAAIEQAISQRGYKRRELEEFAERKERVSFIFELQQRKATLNQEITSLKGQLQELDARANQRRSRIMTLVSEKAGYILEHDLKSEKEFLSHPEVTFSFWDDHIAVDERRSFSGSSLTILRNALHAALLMASTDDSEMYYPRFLMMDNVEDKGMTESRSQNFQKVLAEISANIEVDHQIILTTSMIAPELADSPLVVGPYYDFEQKSLAI